MAKVSKEGVIKVLTHVTLLAVLVIGGSASQQQDQGCCNVGGGSATSGGDGGDGAGGEGGDKNCIDHSAVDLMAPMVSFKTDVVHKIFQQSCSVGTSCHESKQMGADPQPYLGPPAAAPLAVDTEVNQVHAEIYNISAVKESGMKLVDPGHPETSFMMYKIDHDLDCSRLTCGATCGDPMPPKDMQLTKEQRDTVRRWIAQGAKNN